MILTKKDVLSRRIQIIIRKYGKLRENILQLNIKRGFCFQDFVKAFRKRWNGKKKSYQYIISFIEEAGVNNDGVSREFYAGWDFKFLLETVYAANIIHFSK